jgi:hypothetical protein
MRTVLQCLTFAAVLVCGTCAPAAATCSWMLWTENEVLIFGKQPRHDKWWKLENTYPTRSQCEDAQRRVWEVVAGRCDKGQCPGVKRVNTVPNHLVVVTFKPDAQGLSGHSSERLICVPDTVDPRPR